MIASQNYIKSVFLDKEVEMRDLKNQMTFLTEKWSSQQEQHKPLLQTTAFPDWTKFTPQQDLHLKVSQPSMVSYPTPEHEATVKHE